MDINRQNNEDNLTAEITITLSPEDYKPEVDKELKEQAKKASLPGFRPGKVPVNMVRKMAGKSVVVDVVNKKLGKALQEYLESDEINILGDPMPTEPKDGDFFDEYCEKTMDFTFEVGLSPEFEVKYELDEKSPKYSVKVDDAFVKTEIERLREMHGVMADPPQTAEEGDIVYGKLFEVDKNGETVEGGFDQLVPLNPARISNKEAFAPLIGLEIGAVADFDPFSISKKKEEVAAAILISEEELDELKGKKFKLEIKRLSRTSKAEMNEEFFEKAIAELDRNPNREKKVETEEEFLETITGLFQEQMDNTADWHFRNRAKEMLMEANPVVLPEEFLKKWILASREGYTEQRVENEFEDFKTSTHWSLIVGKLMKKFPHLKLEDGELEEKIRESVRSSIASMGLGADREEEFVKHSLENRELLDMHYRQLLEDKINEFFDAEIQAEEKDITASEFVEELKSK